VVAGEGGPADLFCFYLLQSAGAVLYLRPHNRKDREMTPEELYALLDAHGIDYEIIEIFEGARLLNITVWEEEND
jgi:hypothetical protein